MKLDKSFFARSRVRFLLGSGMASIVISLMNILTFAKVWEDTFKYYNIPTTPVYIAFPIVYVIACWYIGLWYEQSGLWSAEASHTNQNMNPEISGLCKDMIAIKEALNIKDDNKKE